MKIIGPIAGIGSRLRPFTYNKPKAFLEVAGKSVLDHILAKFSDTFDPTTELIFIVGYKKRQIIDYIKKKYENLFKLTFIEQIPRGYSNDIPYFWGLGEAIYLSHTRFKKRSFKSKEEDKREGSLIFLGDMIPIDDYSYYMYRYFESDVDGMMVVMEVSKDKASSYGIVTLDNELNIQSLVEKPKKFISNLAIAGIYAFSHTTMLSLFESLKGYLDKRTEDSKEIYLTESLQNLVDKGFKIKAVKIKKGILDFGRPSEVLTGNQYLLGQNASNREEFPISNISSVRSFIKNPVFIGKNSKIINSVIGPFVSIGEDSYIEDSILENSVIEKRVQLKKIISKNSIIGSDVQVENISKDNLIIGDKSSF
ncbi:MAG: sugar phosphate nucleotidyltransferase [Promethearchaeota archaeon]|jgi:glucose-1-phosphate thymidylyltransferase